MPLSVFTEKGTLYQQSAESELYSAGAAAFPDNAAFVGLNDALADYVQQCYALGMSKAWGVNINE